MKISYNWLKDYVRFDLDADRVAEILTSIGLEVESMEIAEKIPGGLAGVVVAHVCECVDHPDSDHLHITKVDTGSGEPLQVVCGAPNVAAGQKVLLATVGTRLPAPDGSEFKIKKSKIRGVESFGMICAEDELGLGSGHDGIMVLDDDAVPGTPASEYLKLESDTVFEIGLTPNRVDAASHIGVARDLSAYLKLNGMGGEMTLPEAASIRETDASGISVEVVDREAAPIYSGVLMENVKVGPSPDWLRERLNAVGIRSINNVVDVTNYVLQETGLPMHAFDADRIAGGRIIVKCCENGTKFTTLDGVEHELTSEDLMICDSEKPMCMAGIFGGLDSGVSDSTVRVFLESAYFNPVYIRKSSKRHGIKTDASFRYERGADPMMLPYALGRAVSLLEEVAGASVSGPVRCVKSIEPERKTVDLDFGRMSRFIGKDLSRDTYMKLLEAMDFRIISDNGSDLVTVSVPTYRVDVYRECDIVEDLLRIYGYNNVEVPQHMKASINFSVKPDPERMKVIASELLVSNGFNEIMNNSLTRSAYYDKLASFPADRLVRILNPLSSDLNAMRQTLLFGGLEVVAYNINRQYPDLRLFELGNVYSIDPDADASLQTSYREEMKLSVIITGSTSKSWRSGQSKGDFFVLKGYLELLMKRFGLSLDSFEQEYVSGDIFSEGLVFRTRTGEELGVMGIVSQSRRKVFGIKQEVFAAEISWNVLVKLASLTKVQYRELPKYPEVRRDLALLLDENVPYLDIRRAAFATEKKLLKSVELFDVYTGDRIPQGKKQYAISFVLQDTDRTLTDKAVEVSMEKLLDAFRKKFGAELR